MYKVLHLHEKTATKVLTFKPRRIWLVNAFSGNFVDCGLTVRRIKGTITPPIREQSTNIPIPTVLQSQRKQMSHEYQEENDTSTVCLGN